MQRLSIHRSCLLTALCGVIVCDTACRGPTESIDPAAEFPVGLIFSSDGSDARFARAATPPAVQVLPGRLVVWGAIVTGTSCNRATGAITQSGDSTNVALDVVTALPSGTSAGCPARLTGERYRATIDAPAGPHRLRVRHAGPEFTGAVLDTLIVIPVP